MVVAVVAACPVDSSAIMAMASFALSVPWVRRPAQAPASPTLAAVLVGIAMPMPHHLVTVGGVWVTHEVQCDAVVARVCVVGCCFR